MDNFLGLIANDNKNNANAILNSLLVGEDVRHHVQVSTLSNFLESPKNLSLTSNGEVIHSASGNIPSEAGNNVDKELTTNEELTNQFIGKRWTKDKRNTSAKYMEKLEHRRTTFQKNEKQ